MLLTIMSQNVAYGGLQNAAGAADDRWDDLAQQIRDVDPDIVLLQELVEWRAHNRKQLSRAENSLGMRIAGELSSSASGMDTAVFYRHSAVRCRMWENRYIHQFVHGLSVAVFEVDGLSLPLTVISTHLNPFSAQGAAQEAQILIARAWRYDGLCVLGGDINHFPLDPLEAPVPHPLQIPAYNRSSRWLPDGNGGYRPNRIVGETLAVGGLTDAAAHLAAHTGDASLLDPTARGGVRVDQMHLTPALVPALGSYRRIDHPHSDHNAIVIDLDVDRIDLDASEEFV